jgi:protein MpaA
MSHRIALLPLLLLVACRAPAVQEPPAIQVASGLSVEGRPIAYSAYGSGQSTLLLLASIHGDETAGTRLLGALEEKLRESPAWLEGRRAVVVPVLNPDGVARGTRHNANGVDLNRNLPSDNWKRARAHGPHAASEPETRFLVELIRATDPWRIVVFHQHVNLVDWDGPARDLARRMAEASTLGLRKLGARPGSLGSYAGVDLGIPTITVELPRSADRLTREGAWESYGKLVVEAFR